MNKPSISIYKFFSIFVTSLALTSCAQKPFEQSEGHIKPISQLESEKEKNIPPPILNDIFLPPPQMREKEELYTVVVHELPVGELLFALARDAKKNIDIAPGINGTVTLNAIDQTLTQILDRLKRQTDLRYQIIGDTLVISPDSPYHVQYKVPYINMERASENEVSIATQVSSTGQGAGGESGGGGGSGSNSSTKVNSKSAHQFWVNLVSNLRAILRDEDSIKLAGQDGAGSDQKNTESSKSDNNIVVHQEAGIVNIRASQRKHAEVAKYIANVLEHVSRQVLIEATIVEVSLSDEYKTGVDWSLLTNQNSSPTISVTQDILAAAAIASPPTAIAIAGQDIIASIEMLNTFGNTRVLSSPKLMVLNNQTAVLKVVKNQVYFTMTAEQSQSVQGQVLSTIETQVHTVPVGLVMSVTPQISTNDEVIMNVRPTISRQTGSVSDPNPEFVRLGVSSEIPVIDVREMESILRVHSGDVAIIGGLMENETNNITKGTPGLSRIDYLDNLFSFKDRTNNKTELIIFIRPRVIKSASLKGDLKDFNRFLHDEPVNFPIPEFK